MTSSQKGQKKNGDAPNAGPPDLEEQTTVGAMELANLNADSLSTRADFPDRCQRFVNGLDSVNRLDT